MVPGSFTSTMILFLISSLTSQNYSYIGQCCAIQLKKDKNVLSVCKKLNIFLSNLNKFKKKNYFILLGVLNISIRSKNCTFITFFCQAIAIQK